MGKKIWIKDEAYWALVELKAILRKKTYSDVILTLYEIVKKKWSEGEASDLKKESK